MISGVKVNDGDEAKVIQSEAVGQLGLQMVNEYRGSKNLSKISWNTSLHDLAFLSSKEFTKSQVAIVMRPNASRMASIKPFLPYSVSVGEMVNESNLTRTSEALSDVFS